MGMDVWHDRVKKEEEDEEKQTRKQNQGRAVCHVVGTTTRRRAGQFIQAKSVWEDFLCFCVFFSAFHLHLHRIVTVRTNTKRQERKQKQSNRSCTHALYIISEDGASSEHWERGREEKIQERNTFSGWRFCSFVSVSVWRYSIDVRTRLKWVISFIRHLRSHCHHRRHRHLHRRQAVDHRC